MADIEILLATDEPNLTAMGEIYRAPMQPHDAPVVANVIARNQRSAACALEPGDYAFHFHVELGEGAFTLTAHDNTSDTDLSTDDFDTADGFHGRVFDFTVAP